MSVQKFVTRVLIPCGSAVLIPPLMPLLRADEDSYGHHHGQHGQTYYGHETNIFEGLDSYPNQSESYMSPQDLPIYDKSEYEGVEVGGDEFDFYERGSPSEKIQQGVTRVRRAVVTNVVDNMNIENNKEKLRDNVDSGINRIRRAYNYISREENYVARAAAITSGGLIGLFLARRGGMIKKIFYTSVGITGVSSAVYPKEASVISEDLFKIGKYYAIVAYQKMQESVK